MSMTVEELFRVAEADFVDRTFVALRAGGLVIPEEPLVRALASALVTRLFPLIRRELQHPTLRYDQVADVVDREVVAAIEAAIDRR
jgi:hypothetical protein